MLVAAVVILTMAAILDPAAPEVVVAVRQLG
jgi:hypothetical protein